MHPIGEVIRHGDGLLFDQVEEGGPTWNVEKILDKIPVFSIPLALEYGLALVSKQVKRGGATWRGRSLC